MTNLYKKKSNIHGFGIFAGESIAAGTIFYDVPMDEISDTLQERCAFIGKNRWVCDETVLNWVNHSCNSNAELVIGEHGISLKATRNIGEGDEITCDYNKTETNGQRVSCNCRERSCRGYFLTIK